MLILQAQPILSAPSSRTFCWLGKTCAMPAKITGFTQIFSFNLDPDLCFCFPSFWHFLISYKTHHIPLNKCPAPNVIMSFLSRKIIIRKLLFEFQYGQVPCWIQSAIFKLAKNLGSSIFNCQFDDQETAAWVPIWPSAMPQLSPVNIQLSGDCYSIIWAQSFLLEALASQASAAHCMLYFFVIWVEKWSLQKSRYQWKRSSGWTTNYFYSGRTHHHFITYPFWSKLPSLSSCS